MTEPDPYADFRDDEIPTNLMTVLVQLSDELVEAEKLVALKEEELDKAKQAFTEIEQFKIPNAAEGLQGKFKLPDGRELIIKEEIHASIAGEKRVPAINWLDQNDYGHIVKRQIVIEFGKDSDEEVKSFLKALGDYERITERPLNFKETFTVHPQTLMAFVREKFKEGVDLPKQTFGIFHQKKAKVKE